MDRVLCQLCYTIVRCGENHPCFFYRNDEDFYSIPKPHESKETDTMGAMLEEAHPGNFNDSSVTIHFNLPENIVEATSEETAKNNEQISLSGSKRKTKSPSLLAGNSNNAWSLISRNNSSLDSTIVIRNRELNSIESNSTSKSFWDSKNTFKSPTTLVNTAFPLGKTELNEFETSNDPDTSIATRADIDSFSSNKNMKLNFEPSQEFMKNVSVMPGDSVIPPRLHKRADTQNYDCGLCPKQFKNELSLVSTYRKSTEENTVECKTCGKRFGQKANLKRHYQTHIGEKPLKCDTCGMRFKQKSYLENHRRTHTGENPYGCNSCDKRFSRKTHLENHLRTHTGEKPFKCDTCGMRFNQKSNLETHRRTHTGEKSYGCNSCDKRFNQKSNLTTHRRTHTGEKPYGCNSCDKRFSQKTNLDTHLRTHTGEKQFGCDVCGKRFSQKIHLKTHRLTHAGKKA